MKLRDPRYHALDSLRAVMMFLGIYLHVVVAYSNTGGWPYKQPEVTGVLNWSLGLIHLFRMPVFYVMAGFFGALLHARRSWREWLSNRAGRVAVPFAAGWVLLFPLVVFLSGFGKGGWGSATAVLGSGQFLKYAHPMHLWFLEYLIILYCLTGGAAALLPNMPGARRLFGRLAGWWAAPAVFAIPSFLALLPMRYAGLEDPPRFLPAPRIVAAYLAPFVFGWLFYEERDKLALLARRAWVYLAVAAVPLALYLGFIRFTVPRVVSFYADRALHSLAMWLLIFGLIGLFQRYLDGESPRMRYLSDSSYFLYLAHMPVILVYQLALRNVGLPPLAKAALVLPLACGTMLPLYHYLVRPTFVGAVLNGRRYPRGAVGTAATGGAWAQPKPIEQHSRTTLY